MESGTLDSSGVLLLYHLMPLASHMTIILISALFYKTFKYYSICIYSPIHDITNEKDSMSRRILSRILADVSEAMCLTWLSPT